MPRICALSDQKYGNPHPVTPGEVVRIRPVVSGYAARIGRRLPRGWGHFGLQFAIWFGFYVAYQIARGAADRSVVTAFENGRQIIEFQYNTGSLVELHLERIVERSSLLVTATAYTYWLSQFAVVGLTLLWVYFKHHERFADFRNWLIGANLIGLLGYVLVPTAPPRMFPEWGFTDVLAEHSAVNHSSGLVSSLANPYAAMPSLHVMDAVIVSIVMVSLVRSRLAKLVWALWAPWVAFAVMSTGNHFWLDCAAGAVIALLTGAVLFRERLFGRFTATADA
jgi:membrane-associated phospholipid phosphatase